MTSPSALTPAGSTRRWRRIRLRILRRDGWRCMVPDDNGIPCARPLVGELYAVGETATVDHKTRRVDGGTDDPDNLRAACWPCNNARNHRDREPLTAAEMLEVARSWGWNW